MAVSQNGWPVISSGSDSRLVNFPSVTGKVRAGDVATVLTWYQKQYAARVEPITRSWSWGWAYRAIRGASSGFSNHASATSIDNNAPRHPLGTSPNRTMTANQRREVRAIIKESGGVLRWGGDYYGRKDTMHTEINASAAAVRNFANKIRGGDSVKPTSTSKPKPISGEFPAVALAVDGVWKARTTRAYELMLRDAAGTYKRAIDDNFGYHAIVAEQTWLKKIGWYKGDIDGKREAMTIAALRGFLKSKKLYKATDKAPTNRALQRYLNTQRKYIRR